MCVMYLNDRSEFILNVPVKPKQILAVEDLVS